jgi:aspartokinase-like uncharacterized kinase
MSDGAGELVVVKVGGSLFDLPDLGPRLRHWLDGLGAARVVLVPGGGAAADVVRDLDRRHGLGEKKAHWLALRAMTLNAWFLCDLLMGEDVQEHAAQASAPARHLLALRAPNAKQAVTLLDAEAFARSDDGRPGCLPHTWAATSDSVAARFAVVCGATELVLLKSAALPEGIDWPEAGWRGFVDGLFASVLAQAELGMRVRTVNFRTWQG